MSSTKHLIELGLNQNEAKTLDALISLGPTGASDVHKYSGMPRNKAYESLESLARRGMVEIQQGRPTLYRAIGVKAVIDRLLEDYSREAKEALNILEKKQDDLREDGIEDAATWMVRGELGVKRRLAELIYSAKEDIFGIGGYPPKYPLAVKTALKAAAQKGVRVRVVSMARPFGDFDASSDDLSVIEFRTIKTSPKVMTQMDRYDEKLIGSFRGMSGYGGVVIIDENTAFDIVDDGKDPKKVRGIVFRAPGVPLIQKATIERVIGLYTRKV